MGFIVILIIMIIYFSNKEDWKKEDLNFFDSQPHDPNITREMYNNRLIGTFSNGPEHVQKFIKPQRHILFMMIDYNRNKLIFAGITKIYEEIDFADIVSFVCLDANIKREDRHRIEIVSSKHGVYIFNVNNPYAKNPMPFVYRLNAYIDK